MELKSRCTLSSLVRLWSSNRTFMELKCRIYGNGIAQSSSSNRTFMELKYGQTLKSQQN